MTATLTDTITGIESGEVSFTILDREVARALQYGGSREAVEILARHAGGSVYRYCCQILKDKVTADDVYQKTFLQVYRDIGDFDGQCSIRSWLFAIAHNRCLDELKMDGRRQKRFSLCDSPPDVPDAGPPGDETVLHHELATLLKECVGQLDPEIRVAVILRYQEGFTYPEMERICGERAATLQARVTRALNNLRQCLKRKGAL